MSEDVHTEPLRVVLADDHPEFREGMVRLLQGQGIEVVADVSSGEAAVRAVEEFGPDVVVMDLNMPGMSGLEATRRVTRRAQATPVLVLTVSAQEADVTEAILAGAMGYVLKDGPVEEVVEGIRAAAAGHSVISPRIAKILMQRARYTLGAQGVAPALARRLGGLDARGVVPARAPLSARELEVLRLMAQGKSNYEIAEQLVLSRSTVTKHASSILRKLRVENRVQAAVRAIRNRLV